MANMTFDPPPTKEHVSSKPSLAARHFPSFSSSRRSSSPQPPACTTDDILAAKYQKSLKLVSSMRTTTAAITFAFSIAIIACAANSLRAYSSSNLGSEWLLPLWPSNVDLRPTHSTLACGIIILVSSLAYLAAAFFPSPQPKTHRLNVTSGILFPLGLFITIFTAIFASTINSHLSNNTGSGTLMSWTCKWQSFQSISPPQFEKICTETIVSLDLVILIVILQALAVAITGWGWWMEMKLKKMAVHGDIKLMGVAV